MKYTKIYTGKDNKSYFMELDSGPSTEEELGFYSEKFNANGLIFVEGKDKAVFDWHNAPRTQYIFYLEGEIEVEASGGETRRFKAGDILLADDLTGKGHITRVLKPGRVAVVTI